MQKLRPAIRSGQHVIVRDEPWLVVHSEALQDAALVTLRGLCPDNLGETLRVLEPFDAVRAGRARPPICRGTRRDAFAAAAAAIAEAPHWRDAWTAAAAKIDLRPWQLEPALAAVRGTSRLLLADGVGLGKTIQALLIVCELTARALVRRVLVLTPASLCEQWAGEASRRFGLTATVFDHGTLASATSALPVGVNPWSSATLIVSSIDLVKRGEVRASLDAVPLDLLIVDEAHHLTPSTDRAAVVADLAARTPWLVLLTATPHTGDEAAYRFLCDLGDVGGDGAVTTFRRRADEVTADLRPRRQKSVAVSTTPSERMLLDETVSYARAVERRFAATDGAALVAAVIARRAASCAASAQRTLERRLALLNGTVSPVVQPALPWDEDEADNGLDDAALAMAGLDDRPEEISWLERLISLASAAARHSSKLAFVRRLLRRTREPLIVFSEYRDVILAVAAGIADLSTVAVLHGGLSPGERRQQLAAFVSGRARTLVATDAAGEGLNLQARCRLVVSLEIPWNPLRLEQRIGRVDRLGQQRTVHALQLIYRQSFEEIVISRFEERRSRSAATADEATDNRSGDSLETSGELVIRSRRLGAAARSVMRTWSTRSVCADRATPRRPAAVVLVYVTDVVDRGQRLVEHHVTAVRVDLDDAALDRRWPIVDLLARVARDRRVLTTVRDTGALEMEALTASINEAADRYERRVDALSISIAGRRGSRPIQASLFDRREEQRSQLREAAVDGWIRNLRRHRESIDARRTLTLAAPQLVAAWIE